VSPVSTSSFFCTYLRTQISSTFPHDSPGRGTVERWTSPRCWIDDQEHLGGAGRDLDDPAHHPFGSGHGHVFGDAVRLPLLISRVLDQLEGPRA